MKSAESMHRAPASGRNRSPAYVTLWLWFAICKWWYYCWITVWWKQINSVYLSNSVIDKKGCDQSDCTSKSHPESENNKLTIKLHLNTSSFLLSENGILAVNQNKDKRHSGWTLSSDLKKCLSRGINDFLLNRQRFTQLWSSFRPTRRTTPFLFTPNCSNLRASSGRRHLHDFLLIPLLWDSSVKARRRRRR